MVCLGRQACVLGWRRARLRDLELFGIEPVSITAQPDGEYSISGYFDFEDDQITKDIHSPLMPEQKLIIISPIRNILPTKSKALASLYTTDKKESEFTPITKREYGEGIAFYFSFDVAQTMWLLHQGRPVTEDWDGDGYLRTGDMILVGDNRPEVAYADEVLFIIQNMIAVGGQPFIHQLPPNEGEVTDALFFWGGDDEFVEGAQLYASDWMKSKGLPYHVNVLYRDGEFNLSKEDATKIIENGHEISVHYNFIDGFDHPIGFTEEDVKRQFDAFFNKYGIVPVCAVNHWLRWTDWAGPAKWMRKLGQKAANNRVPIPHSLMHEHAYFGKDTLDCINSLGFSFGTAFPFYWYDDFKGGNAKIDFLEEPITAYELGFFDVAAEEDLGEKGVDVKAIHDAVDLAAYYHLTMNMFRHPPHFPRRTSSRLSIEEILRYIDSRGIIVLHLGNDALWGWWDARSKSRMDDVEYGEDFLSFTVDCRYECGLIAKVPLRVEDIKFATCDGAPAHFKVKEEFGTYWAFVVVPRGEHSLDLRW